MQSASPAQLVLHAVAPHTYGAHGTDAPSWHAPEPLHAAVVAVPFAQADAHAVPAGQSWQAPAWHLPSVPQVDAAFVAHRPRGSAIPSFAAAHVPFTPPVRAAEHA